MTYPEPKDRILSEDEKEQIREEILDDNLSSGHLADKYDCSPSQIAGIKADLSRRHDLGEVKIVEEDQMLESIIKSYEDFYNSSRHSSEDYKWDNVETFRSKWDEADGREGEEFFEILKDAIGENQNLVSRGNMNIHRKFKSDPQMSSEVIKYLLDESDDIKDRISRFKNFFEMPNAGGTKVASYFLSSLYPEEYIYFKYNEYQKFFQDLGITLEKPFSEYDETFDSRIERYIELNQKAEDILEKIEVEDKDLWNVQDLIWFYAKYWLPSDVRGELDDIKKNAKSAYTRLFALKCFFETQEDGIVSRDKFDKTVKENLESTNLPGNNKSSYLQLKYNVFRDYDLFTASDEEYGVKEEYREYLSAMSSYMNYLWNEVTSDTNYFLVSHNAHPEQLKDGFLKAPYTSNDSEYDDRYIPSHDLSMLSEGDKLLHYKNGSFVGVSKVEDQPELRDGEEEKEFYLQADIDRFGDPVPLRNVQDKLIEEKSKVDEYYALDDKGGKAEGYLKLLTKEGALHVIGVAEGEVEPKYNLNYYIEEPEFQIEIPEKLYFENKKRLKSEINASLNSGKNIIFTGPPGTGKTKLAKHISKQVSGEKEGYKGYNEVSGSIFTTATADWTAFDTIGGYMPSNGDKLEFKPGQFLKCFRDDNGYVTNKWLVIDEINRSDIDKAFGQLFSVLSGDSVELPYERNGNIRIESLSDPEDQNLEEIAENKDIYPVTDSWRLIATMNTLDKASLYEMSYAFMRRFNFVHIGVPELEEDGEIDPAVVDKYTDRWNVEVSEQDKKNIAVLWYKVNEYREIGPSIIEDILQYMQNYDEDKALESATVSLIYPQLEGMRPQKQREFIESLSKSEDLKDDESFSLDLETGSLKQKAEDMFNTSFQQDD